MQVPNRRPFTPIEKSISQQMQSQTPSPWQCQQTAPGSHHLVSLVGTVDRLQKPLRQFGVYAPFGG